MKETKERREDMLFTAPAFAFLFLPISLMFYTVFAKSRKRVWLFAVCVVYQILLNLSAPINLLYLPALCGYTYLVRRTVVGKCPRWLAVSLCAVPILALGGIRYMAYTGVAGFVYPTGLTIPVFASVSYVADSRRDDRLSCDMFSLASYLYFFPTMLVGPLISYRDFCHMTAEQNMSMSLAWTADGVRLYIIGFVKRIAVGAVLVEGYRSIFAYSWETPSLLMILLMIVLVYFGMFFSLWGYYDMSVGIARMFGIHVPEIKTNPFAVATVSEYFSGLFGSIRQWTDDYILLPLAKRNTRAASEPIRIAVYSLCTVMLLRSDISMLIIVVPLTAFAFAASRLRLDRKNLEVRGRRVGVRILVGVLTVFVIGFLWMCVTLGAADGAMLEYIGEVSMGNAEYQTDMVLISFSGVKYLFVVLLGFCTVLPFTETVTRITDGMSQRMRYVRDYASMLLLLILFVFTVLFFLPQFSVYDYTPFSFIIM